MHQVVDNFKEAEVDGTTLLELDKVIPFPLIEFIFYALYLFLFCFSFPLHAQEALVELGVSPVKRAKLMGGIRKMKTTSPPPS